MLKQCMTNKSGDPATMNQQVVGQQSAAQSEAVPQAEDPGPEVASCAGLEPQSPVHGSCSTVMS